MATFYTYILTNASKKVLYTGITNDLGRRLCEHYFKRGQPKTFAGRYYCYYLVYFEEFHTPIEAIFREKEIKNWSRLRKEALINSMNPEWRFLNADIMPWPPEP
ncbi:MAG: GIY-YIG nuclease family protein, partial [Cyclobacteriaceae bacterium]